MNAVRLLVLVHCHWEENSRHHTLDVQFREDNHRIHRGHTPIVMAMLGRVALNLVHAVLQPSGTGLSIWLLRATIGRPTWILAPILA